MDIGFLHLHKTIVLLFMASLFFKTILLTANKLELLRKIRAKTKMVEAIVGTLILVTGVYILYKYQDVEFYHAAKIFLMVAAIPIGIVGLKKEIKPLAWTSVIIFLYIYGISETKSLVFKPSHDFQISEVQVEIEEGSDGEMAAAEAKEIQLQTLAENGKVIYTSLCVQCHGEDGNKGLFKSPMLSESRLAMDARKDIITNGKGNMPKFSYLKDHEIEAVAYYLEKLR